MPLAYLDAGAEVFGGCDPNEAGVASEQEQLLQLLRDHKSMSPQEIWDALAMTKPGAMKLIQPLPNADLIRRIGTRKTGRYILA